MTGGEAGTVVATLLGAFPNLTLEEHGVRVWADLIAELEHFDTAHDVARKFARNSEKPPSIAAFRSAYREERRRVEDDLARERGLPEPSEPVSVPDDVRRWMAENEVGR